MRIFHCYIIIIAIRITLLKKIQMLSLKMNLGIRLSPEILRTMKICLNCGKPLVGKSQNKFCGHICSASYNNRKRHKMSDETRELISKTLKERCQDKKTERICIVCGSKFLYTKGINTKKICSKECQCEYRTNRKLYLTDKGRERING